MQASPIVLTTLAGLSTGLGGALAALAKPSETMLAASAGFAGGVMLTASLADLMPEALEFYSGYLQPLPCGGAIVTLLALGMLTAGLLGRLLPEETELAAKYGQNTARTKAMRTALITGTALLLHNFPEGVLTLFAGTADPALGLRTALAIALHNIPEGLAVAVPFAYATNSRAKGALAALVSGLAEPAGALVALFLFRSLFTPGFLTGTMVLVAGILGMVLVRGVPHISWNFLTTTASVLKGTDGILPAILNTLYVILLTLLIVLPLGVGAAVYLTEYASNRRLIEVIEFTNETLAGIPSILYGLVGMLVFSQALGFQTCLLSGSLTLVVMNLPTIIRTTQESLKTVPQGYREGALGLGAGKWHIIRTIVLPCSMDGIVTGCILAVGRIVGESAALLFTAGAAEVIAKGVVKAYTSNGATLSVLLYLRAFEDGDFASAWGIGAVLLVLVLAINLAARLAKAKLKQKQ